MRRIEQSILYDILNIGYSMLLLFNIHSIEQDSLFDLLCLMQFILTSVKGSLNMN